MKTRIPKTRTAKTKQAIAEFEDVRNLAELRALSTVSLKRPLTDKEFERMMQLKREVFKR